MADDPLYLNLPDKSGDLVTILAGASRVVVTHRSGEESEIQPQRLTLTREQPEVNRIDDDLGAICEVYRQSTVYFAVIQGMPLAAGDQISLYHAAGLLRLRVSEVEDGRARVEAL